MILCCLCLCFVGCLVASPTSTHWIPITLPLSCGTLECLWTLPNIPWGGGGGQNSPQWGTTELDTRRNKYRSVFMHGLVCTHDFRVLLSTEGQENSDTPVKMSSPTQTLVSRCHSPIERIWAPERSGWFQGWGRKIQNESDTSHGATK